MSWMMLKYTTKISVKFWRVHIKHKADKHGEKIYYPPEIEFVLNSANK